MYDHYVAVDWAQKNMAIARMTNNSAKVKAVDVKTDLNELKLYLSQIRGKKILTIEETTTAQWLYVELKGHVDEILICDPYRNHLLSEGPKTDRLDAIKLVTLLKAGMLKPVFHSSDKYIKLRKFLSGYEDLVKAGVRLKNQRSAMLRAEGKDKKSEELSDEVGSFVIAVVDRGIKRYETEKKHYEKQMRIFEKEYPMIKELKQITGIGLVGAIKVAARVVDAKRFKKKGHWLSYCGLVRHEKMSGGRSYGWKKARYCRTLKGVFKTAVMSVIHGSSSNVFREYYETLLKKGYEEQNARHATARRIAVVAWGMMKSGRRFDITKVVTKKAV